MNIEELFALARDKSVKGRTSLVGSVSDLYFGDQTDVTDRERALMTDILRQLINDVESSVRTALAERLADRADAPKDLVTALANDEIRVALPVLMRSIILDDADLLEIIRHRTMQHRLAIAMREQVSETVSDGLVATGESSVITRLLENAGARISQNTIEFLVERSQEIDVYRAPLLSRQELTPELAGRMYRWVSTALRRHILENFDVDQEELDASLGETIEALVADVRERARPGGRPVELAELLAHANALTPRFLIELLRERQISLFEGLLAEMAGLPMSSTRRFLYQPGGEALAILCKAVKISKRDFASIFLLSRQGRPGDKTVDPNEVPRVLEVYDRVRPAAAENIVKRWRHDPDYLAMVHLYTLEQFDDLDSKPLSATG